MTLWERKNAASDHAELEETFVVPGLAHEYSVELDCAILQVVDFTVHNDTDNVDLTTILTIDEDPGTAEVAVKQDHGLLKFNSALAGKTITVTYFPRNTVNSAQFENQVQLEVIATQTKLNTVATDLDTAEAAIVALDGRVDTLELTDHAQNTDTGTDEPYFNVGIGIDNTNELTGVKFGDQSVVQAKITFDNVAQKFDFSHPIEGLVTLEIGDGEPLAESVYNIDTMVGTNLPAPENPNKLYLPFNLVEDHEEPGNALIGYHPKGADAFIEFIDNTRAHATGTYASVPTTPDDPRRAIVDRQGNFVFSPDEATETSTFGKDTVIASTLDVGLTITALDDITCTAGDITATTGYIKADGYGGITPVWTSPPDGSVVCDNLLSERDGHFQRNGYFVNCAIIGSGRSQIIPNGGLQVSTAGDGETPTIGSQVLSIRTDTTGTKYQNHSVGGTDYEGSVSQLHQFDDTVTMKGIRRNVVTKTANYTATKLDHTIILDATSEAVELTLPLASSVIGQDFCAPVLDGTNGTSIVLSGADAIITTIAGASAGLIASSAGACVTLRALSAGVWTVVSNLGWEGP